MSDRMTVGRVAFGPSSAGAMRERIAKMADRVAQNEVEDTDLAELDQALDMMMAAAQIVNERLPKIETESVQQKAALDEVRQLMDEAVAPYLADIAKAMQAFD